MASKQVFPAPVAKRGLARGLTMWFQEHGRDFPWRASPADPWAVLLSEVLLRQTSAGHVRRVFMQLWALAPTPAALMEMDKRLLKGLLYPLGLQDQRIAALQALSVALVHRHSGKVPESYHDLLSLPHIGPYAAGAVTIFAFNGRAPLPDVNVARVGSRYFGTPRPATKRELVQVAHRVLGACPRGYEPQFFYGLIDLAALVCRPRPQCDVCPVSTRCAYPRRDRHTTRGSRMLRR